MQPGDTITPGAQTPPETQEQPKTEAPHADAIPQSPVGTPEPTPVPQAPLQAAESTTGSAPDAGWQFSQEETQPGGPANVEQQTNIQPVSWTASEYISHQKGAPWFAALGVGLFVVVALVYFVTHDIVPSVLVGIAGITFGAFAARQPRVLEYRVDQNGVQMGQRFYPYHEFKSFSLTEDGPLPSILLLPLKRFLPPITVFYDPQSEDSILDVLSSFLPLEDKKPDAVDKLMRHIRF